MSKLKQVPEKGRVVGGLSDLKVTAMHLRRNSTDKEAKHP